MHQKSGGRPRRQAQMRGFRSALFNAGLDDLDFKGLQFTWEHAVVGRSFVREHLDHAVASLTW